MRKNIFFSGLGGSGVSAIAGFMKYLGHTVSGSDRAFDMDPNHPLLQPLRRIGISIHPQDGSGITDSLDLVVMSTAVEEDRPEVVRARALGIPVRRRPEYLAELMSSFRTVAVAGTSGKSTTSGMLACLMHRLGMGPNFIGGARAKDLRELSVTGNFLTGSSEHLVIEACESDGSIVNYCPERSIILNLALDHHAVDDTAGMFRALIENTSGTVFTNADDENLKSASISGAVTFSIENPSDYRAADIELRHFGSRFSLSGTHFSLSVPGRHNVYNALACISALSEMGVPLEEISEPLREFSGIERRFDVHLNEGGMLVIDDYAHSPHKISSLMQTMRNMDENVCYVFQPHGFAPTRLLKNEYIRVFSEGLREGDHLVLLPVYYAGGTVARDISSRDLEEGIREKGASVELLQEREMLFKKLGEWRCYVVMGARDETLSAFAGEIARRLSPQAAKTHGEA
jgi:UDP-N-acetylmuramate--alanine ligase